MKETDIINSADSSDVYIELRREGIPEDKATATVRQLEQRAKESREQMSSADKLCIDPYLDKRRREYGILDGAFEVQPIDDRVFIYQIDAVEGTKYYAGGLIERPNYVEEADKNQSTRGVLVAWGIKARDELVPYDCRLGDIVEFIEMAPFKKPIGRVLGKPEYVLILRAGHLIGNLDAEARRRDGTTEMKVVRKSVTGTRAVLLQHRLFIGADGPGDTSIRVLAEINQPMVLEEY